MRIPGAYPLAWLLVLALALGLRWAAARAWESRLPAGQRFGFGDSDGYWQLGGQLARGEPYAHGPDALRVFRAPGYPLLLAAVFRGHAALPGARGEPSTFTARMAGVACGLLAVALVGVLAWRLFDARAALVAGALAAVYPGGVGLSVFLLSEALFCPLMLAQLVCWIMALGGGNRLGGDSNRPADARPAAHVPAAQGRLAAACGWALAAGCLGGAATLTRPSWLLFTPATLAFMTVLGLARGDKGWRKTLLLNAAHLAALVLTLTPWWARSYALTGKFVPTTLQVGASLYDGWNPQARGGSDMRFVESFRQAQLRADAEARDRGAPLESTFEYRLDRRLRDAAAAWAAEHPARVVELAAIKFWRIWSPWPNAAEMQNLGARLLLLLGCAPLAVLGWWGAARFGRGGWPYVLCILPAFYFTALHMVFVGSIRYRQPALLPMLALAAAVLVTAARRRGRPTSASG